MNDKKIYKQTKRVLILTTVLFSLLNILLVSTIYISIVSMELDSSDIGLPFLIFLMTIGTFPVVCSLSIIFSWILFSKSYYQIARIVALLPFVNIAVAFLIWILFSF